MFRHKHRSSQSVLSIYPVKRGFAYVLFEAPLSPHDWGTREIKKDATGAAAAQAARELLERYRPDVLVLESLTDHRGGSRSLRIARIHKIVSRFARDAVSAEVVSVSRRDVRAAFSQFGALTKHDIAKVIAKNLDAFATRMPKERRAWGPEDRRMGIFDAASRALTFYYQREEGGEGSV
jgi:hypothetical protein